VGSIYLFSRHTLAREIRFFLYGILSFIVNVIIFPRRSMYAAALRGFSLSPFMKGPLRTRYIMKDVVLDDISSSFFDTDSVVREHVRIRGGLALGKRSYIGQGTVINGPVTIGDGCFVNHGSEINAETVIGENVIIGPGVKFLSKTHEIGTAEFRAGNLHHRPIRVERGVWIGGGVIILGNVTIGSGAVVGAGAVVTKDIPKNSVAVGNPARVIRKLGPGYGGGEHGSTPPPHKIKWA
jgi:acetyltransferase-like isoleucine patch superfamily enzyme